MPRSGRAAVEETGQGRRRHGSAVVGLAEERDASASDDAAHLEIRELDARDAVEYCHFLIGADEVVAVMKPFR